MPPLHPLDSVRERLHAAKLRRQRARHGHGRGIPAPGSNGAQTARRETPRRSAAARRIADPIARLVNDWWTRLLSAIYNGSLSEAEEEYDAGETGRDYLWNTIGTSLWGAVFPILTVVATQLAGTEDAGRFSMAFVMGTLLMILANYGVRTFQASDIDEETSFSSYQINRWLSSLLALIVGILYCALRGYETSMVVLSMGVYVYKVVDGLADVYEGRLQQADKLYLAGISQALRSAVVVVAFSILLLVTRSCSVAAVAMAVAAVATLVLVTIPLALLETEASRPWRVEEVTGLFRHCLPLFAAMFIFNFIESMPKFAMESMLPYDNQLYFNALYFPAQGILLSAGFVFKPQLVRLANIWANPRRRRRFDLIVLAMLGVIVLICAVTLAFMAWLGIPLMSFMYGVDFEPYRGLAYLMVIAGGITAAIDFLYAIITVLRHQTSAYRPYLIALALSLIVPVALIMIAGLAGAVLGYLAVMLALLVGLAIVYLRIRSSISERMRSPFERIR